ncbi:PUL domain-containing protein [Cercophora newfieldiana]|uniref:PUL domain-containing protein n=1 Tax=Cercophora newfieldiana TaxID=92897 RepID=A0AA40D0X1_9PEZI|nr:PUL domain-containing protein [Cercophora newfieldiana]
MPEFQLSAELRGHEKDVRCVIFPSPDFVISGSRDSTTVLWRKPTVPAGHPPKFTKSNTIPANHYVNSLAYQPPSNSSCPEGLLVRGGGDHLIEINNPAAPEDNHKRLLVGHSGNVCALDVAGDGSYLVSGSWDGKAIVWSTKAWEPVLSLEHSEETKAVWAVLSYSKDVVITACADTYIRIFRISPSEGSFQQVAAQRSLKTDDVVRALCRFPVGGPTHPTRADFASAGNDSIIRLWKIDGTQVASLYGHESFIYSLACLPTGELVSSGEDRTVRIWKDRECVQTITLPAISVWQVAVCQANGDIAAATSDHVVRIFTRSPERVAEPDAISDFDAAVQQSQVKGNTIDRKNLKTKEWLTTAKGEKHQQVVLVSESDGSIAAYQWSEVTNKWDLLGTVVDSAEAAGDHKKVEYQGKEYDFVFDVDTEDGKPPHKLPYNLGEDTYQAATKFLNENNLPISYLEAVAQFIRENTAGAQQSVPSTPARPASPNSKAPTPATRFLPHTEYLAITSTNLGPAFRRLKEFNQDHIKAGNKHIAMNPDDLARLESMISGLLEPPKSPIPPESTQIVLRLLTQWPYRTRLPLLDVLRCMAARPGLASFPNTAIVALRSALNPKQFTDPGDTLPQLAPDDVNWKEINPHNLMMALRTVANLFSQPEGRAAVAKEAGTVIDLMGQAVGIDGQEPFSPENVNVQVALITTAFNYACLAYNERQRGIDATLLSKLLRIGATIIRHQKDNEVLFRAVMTIGMVIASGGPATQLVSQSELQDVARQAQGKTQDTRVHGVLRECKKLLGN